MLSQLVEVPCMAYASATPTPRIAMKINNAKEFVVLISIPSVIQASCTLEKVGISLTSVATFWTGTANSWL